MNKHLIGALIIAATAAAAGPAFASGYGPAVHYDPISGAPTSQRGQSVQTLRENYNATEAHVTRKTDTRSYGGIADSTSNWGDRRGRTSRKWALALRASLVGVGPGKNTKPLRRVFAYA